MPLAEVMYQVVRYVYTHFGIGFYQNELLEQPQSPKNYTISRLNMQVICQCHGNHASEQKPCLNYAVMMLFRLFCSCLDKQFGYLFLAFLRGNRQRGFAVIHFCIDVGSLS